MNLPELDHPVGTGKPLPLALNRAGGTPVRAMKGGIALDWYAGLAK